MKMVSEYRRRGKRVTSLVWSRGEAPSSTPDMVTCTVRSGYGRGLGGIGARLAFMWFLVTYMLRHRRHYDVVHVVDLDTGIVGVPIARLLGKPVIYDAFDHISASAGQGWVGGVLARVERCMIGLAAIAIFPDLIRLEQYGVEFGEKVRVIGNIPDLAALPANPVARKDGPLLLVYIGTLESIHRGLEYIPDICAAFCNRIEIIVGGMGELHEFFKSASSRIANLTYIGQQDYDAALRQMANADCLYGPYLLSAPAHRYASPNKMYEHLALGKPLITNKGTPPAELVRQAESGFLFDGGIDDLLRILTEIDRSKCARVGRQAATAWNRDYAKLREQQLASFFAGIEQVVEASL
jgi:glycosyltransferase involved in cell wall biosynthesis